MNFRLPITHLQADMALDAVGSVQAVQTVDPDNPILENNVISGGTENALGIEKRLDFACRDITSI